MTTKLTVKMSNKRNAVEMGAGAEDTEDRKRRIFGIENLKFFIFTLGDGSVPCKPEEANAIEKAGIIYKQVGRGFDLTFASLKCMFIRMREDLKRHTTPTAKTDHNGRSIVQITDDDGKPFETQALKFASLAWGQVSQLAKLGTAGMPLRDFKRAFPVDHIDGNPSNNDVSNGMIMTKAEHDAKTKLSAEQIAKKAMSQSAPCTMTFFVSKGKPLHDSEGNPVVINYDHRKKAMIRFDLTALRISNSIARKDMPTRNSLVKIKYDGQDCLAQFSWYNLPDLEGEIWKKLKKADHLTLELPMSETYEYYVSNMTRFKTVTKSTQNAKIRDFRGQERPQIKLMKKNLYFYRIVALVFHREQMNEYIAEQKAKTGIVWTFATGQYQLEVDHIDLDPTNHCANNLQFLTPQENTERSNGRPCIIWEIGKKDAQKEYRSVTAVAKEMRFSNTTVHTIIKNNKHKKWRGEYIVE